MSKPPREMEDAEVQLIAIPGTGDLQNDNNGNHVIVSTEDGAASCCDDKHHRKLAICSIICGISCIGIRALINSVKAKEATDVEQAAKFSQRAKKLGIISIVTWVAILASVPILTALISYLFTLWD